MRIISLVNSGLETLDELIDLIQNDPDQQKTFSFAEVKQLNLHGNRLDDIEGLEKFPQLIELCLSNNCIENFVPYNFSRLQQLVILDLSANEISDGFGFCLLPALEELFLAHNCIRSMSGFTKPVKFPQLSILDLRDNLIEDFESLIGIEEFKVLTQLRLQEVDGAQRNRVCEDPEYPIPLLQVLSHLRWLDGEELTPEVKRLYMPRYNSALQIWKRRRTPDLQQSSLKTLKIALPSKRLSQGKKSSARRNTELEARNGSNEMSLDSLSHEEVSVATQTDADVEKLSNDVKAHKDAEVNTNFPDTPYDNSNSHGFANSTYAILDRSYTEASKAMINYQKELERRIGSLETEIIRAGEKLQEDDRIIVVLTKKITALRARLQDDSSRLLKAADPSNETSEKQKECIAMQTEQDNIRDTVRTADLRLATKRKKQRDKLKDELDNCCKTLQEVTAELTSYKKRYLNSQKMIEDLQTRLHLQTMKATDAASDKDNQIMAKDQELATFTAKLANLAKKVSSQQEELDCSVKTIQVKEEEITRLTKDRDQKENDLKISELRYDNIVASQDALLSEQAKSIKIQLHHYISLAEKEFCQANHSLEQRNAALLQRLQDATAENFRMRAKLQNSSRWNETLTKIGTELQSTREKGHQVSAEARCHISELQHQNEKLQNALTILQKEREQASPTHNSCGKDSDRSSCYWGQQVASMLRDKDELEQQWLQKEQDWKAALKIKDVVLDDQLRQIENMHLQIQECDVQLQGEHDRFDAHIRELETAMDELLRRLKKSQAKTDNLKRELLRAKELEIDLEERLKASQSECDQKDQQVKTLAADLVTMQLKVDQHSREYEERLEREEEHYKQLLKDQTEQLLATHETWKKGEEADRHRLIENYNKCSNKYKAAIEHNRSLQSQLQRNDNDLRVLITQIDHERRLKRESLQHLRSLFKQLQQTSM